LLCALLAPAASVSPRPIGQRGGAVVALGALGALAIVTTGIDRDPAVPANEAQARAALRRMPIDQHALAVLALSAQERNPEQARALMLRAAPLGWRDPLTQLWLFGQYADEGHYAEAIARADALMRTGRKTPALLAAMRQGTADSGFSAALADALATNPPWRQPYLTSLDELKPPLAPQAALLRELAKRGAPPSFEEAGAFVGRAVKLGDTATAPDFWRGTAQASGAGLLPDPRFRRIDSDGAARGGWFGWHRTDIEGLSAETELHEATVLTVEQTASGTLLYQTLLLPPGGYRLSLPFTVEDGTPAAGLGWTMVCMAPGNRRLDAAPDQPANGARWTAAFVVPADCPVQRLGLRSDGSGLASIRLRLGTAVLTAENLAPAIVP
jgi:hypothetical protein